MAKPVPLHPTDHTTAGTTNSVTAQTGGEVIIRRVTYRLAGQAIAVRVTGDPVTTNNGLFYLHNDHLGSLSAMSDVNGNLVPDSVARYTPFGDWRTEPAAGLTDRGYTGHRSKNLGGGADDLGLIYMNARYYAPGLSRFLSADTIVPNPANPQSLNRYSYTRNNPLNLIDPTGHRDCEFDDHCGPPRTTPEHGVQQLAYPGNLPNPVIEMGRATYDAYCISSSGCTYMETFYLSYNEVDALESAFVDGFRPGSRGPFVTNAITGEGVEILIDAAGTMYNAQYAFLVGLIREAVTFANESSFSEMHRIIQDMSDSQRAANQGQSQPLNIVMVQQMYITGEIETHYNHLAGEYITQPEYAVEVPRFALFVKGPDDSLSHAVLVSNGLAADVRNILLAATNIGQ